MLWTLGNRDDHSGENLEKGEGDATGHVEDGGQRAHDSDAVTCDDEASPQSTGTTTTTNSIQFSW
jgi:hypothetical protein